MKQVIKYFYDIDINEYKVDNKVYYFYFNNQLFYFVEFERNLSDLKNILDISKELKRLNINCHDIIINKYNKVISFYESKNYILIRVSNKFAEKIDIFDIISLNKKLVLKDYKKNYKNDWKILWQNKIDYFESQIRNYGKDKNGVLNTFSYYIGMAENAIEYLEKINEELRIGEYDRITLSHRRIFYPNYQLNYLNPLSFIFDLEVRDYAEYFKSSFFKGEQINEEFRSFLKIVKLGNYSYNMLFARLMFPSYYFDVYEKLIQDELSEETLIEVVNKVFKYELFLGFAYEEISKYSSLISIPWITNKKIL